MQLKIRRSQRDGGVLAKNVIFCLDARADLTQHERANLARYKLYDQVIYNSEASRRHLDKSIAATSEGTATGAVKGLVSLALAAMRLNVTVRSLERGQHIECKSMEELLAAEDAIMQACQQLKIYLDVAATFNGSELVVDFSGDQPSVIAQATRPEPILAPSPEPVAIQRVSDLISDARPASSSPAEEPWDAWPAAPESGSAAAQWTFPHPRDGFERIRSRAEAFIAPAKRAVEDFLARREPTERVVIVGFAAVVVLIVLVKLLVG